MYCLALSMLHWDSRGMCGWPATTRARTGVSRDCLCLKSCRRIQPSLKLFLTGNPERILTFAFVPVCFGSTLFGLRKIVSMMLEIAFASQWLPPQV